MENVSIILVNYNSWKDTIECIDSINKNNYKNYNIIVVDNFSSNDSVEKLEKYFCGEEYLINEIKYKLNQDVVICDCKNGEFCNFNKKILNQQIYFIKNDINGGFSKGNNIGFLFCEKFLSTEYYWVLNNDVIIEKNTIEEQLKVSKENNDNALLGVTILEYFNKELIQCTCGGRYNIWTTISKNQNKGKNKKELEDLSEMSDYISGCSIFGAKKLFEKINFFSEDYFLYFEELDLMNKAKKQGIGKAWARNAFIYHKEGNSIGSKNIQHKKSELSEYHSNISCLKYNKKFNSNKFFIIAINRYILKTVKFLMERDIRLLRKMNQSYRDYFKEGKKKSD